MELLSSGKEQREFRDSGPYKVKKKSQHEKERIIDPCYHMDELCRHELSGPIHVKTQSRQAHRDRRRAGGRQGLEEAEQGQVLRGEHVSFWGDGHVLELEVMVGLCCGCAKCY